jgi:mRNA interferase YafO
MEVRVFTSSLVRNSTPDDKLAALVKSFSQYKTTGIAPANFGRDAPYAWPDAALKADVWHVHTGTWSLQVLQYHRTSDTHLVYCRGFKNAHAYLLISAHVKRRSCSNWQG